MGRTGKSKRPTGDYVVVVGAGVVGLSCALNLARAGARVELIDDQDVDHRTSFGAAGHIAIELVDPLATPAYLRSAPRQLFAFGGALDFRLGDIGVWAPWAIDFIKACTPARAAAGKAALGELLSDAHRAWRRLADDIGRPELIRLEGHVSVWESPATARAGQAEWLDSGIDHIRTEPLGGALAERLAKTIKAPIAGGVRFEETGQFADIAAMLAALREAFVAAGGQVREARVTRLAIVDGQAQAILESGEALAPDHLVVAAGVGSNPLMATIGRRAPVIAERGYHVEGPDLGWGDLPPVTFEDRSMIAVQLGGRMRCTSFVEFGAFGSPPDPRKWERLERHVRELGLPMGEPRTRWMGARPTLPDYLPAIGVDAGAPNLIYAFGHQHLGLTLAATTAEIVTDLASSGEPRLDLRPFDLRRFDGGGNHRGKHP
jgi:glycine/D-amino acid oxidase-like deaminating enzyme